MIGSCSLFCLQENEENGGKSGGYSFTNCTAEILQHRPIKDIRSELIQSTIQTHHDTYVCGVKTLHFLINAWLDKSLKLLQQGVPVFDVCEGLHEGIHECIKNLENISIKIRLDNTENHESIFITSCNLQTDDLTLPIEDLPAPEDLPPSEILPLPTQVFLPPPTEILPHPPEIPFPADILPPPTDILPPPFEDLPAPEDLPPTEFLPPPTEILPPPNEDLSAPGDLPATEILPHWIEDLPPPIEDFPAPFAPSSNTAINNTELSTSSPPTRGQSNEEERGISDDDSDDDDDDDEFVSCLDLTKSGDVLFNLRNIEKRIKTSGFNDNQFTSSNSIQTSSVEPSGVQLSGVQPSSVQPSSNLPSSVQSSSNLLSSVQPSGTLAPTTPPSNVDFPPPYSDLPTQIVDLLPQNDEVPFQVPSAPLNLNSLPPPFNSPLNLNSLPLPPPPLNSAPLNLNSLPPPLNSPLNLNRRDIAAGLNHEYEDEFDACFDDRGKKSTETGKTCELRKLSVGQKIHDDDVFLENTSTTTPSINDLINEKIKFKRPIVTKMSRHYRSENGSDPYSTRQPDAYNSRQPDTYSSYQPDTYSTCQPGAYNSRQPNTYRQPDTDSIRQLDAYNSCQPDTYDSRQPDTYNSRQPDTYSSHHSPDTYSMHHPPDTYSMHHPPDTSERAEHMIYTSSNRKFIGRERVVTSRSLKSSKSSPNILRSKTPELTRRRFEIGKSSKSLNNDDSSSSSGGGGGVQRRGVEKRRVDTRVDSGYHGDTTRSKSLAILNLDSSSIRDESFSTIFTRICDSLIERVKNESLKLENRIVKTQASFNSKLDATFQTMVDSFHDDKDVSASKSERSSESFTGDMDAFRHQGALDVHAIYEQFFMKLNGKSVTAESRESPGTTESTWWESAGNVSVATESTGRESLERESVWRESRGRQSAWRESVGRESTGRESVGRESAWRESVGRESTGRESVGRESAWRESVGRESSGRESVWRESTGRESLGRESPWRESPRMPVSRVRINQCIGDCTDELWQILAELYQRIDTSIESLCLSLRHVISEHRDKKRRCLDDVLSVAVDDERTKIFATSKSMIDQYQSSLLESLHATFEVLKDEVDRKTELLSANVIKDDESLLGKIFKQRSALYDYISESMCSYSTLLQRHCNQLKKLLELFHESAIHKTERIVTTMNQALDDSADLCTNQIREMFRLLTMKSYEIHGETIGIVTRNKRILVDSTTTRTIPVAERQCQNLVQILNVDSESLLVHWEENRASFVAVSSESFQQLIRDVTDRKSALIRLVDENEAWLRAEFRDSVVTATENITKYNEKLIENVTMNCENFFIESSLIPSRFDSPSTTTDDNPDSGKSRQCEIISCSSSGVDLKRIIRGLTRNCDDVSDLLMMTYNKQQTAAANHHHKQQFDVSSVNCYCLQGSISVKPTVVDGIILPASTDVISIIQQDNSTDYNILLIAGDLKSSWKHTGHKDSVNSSVTTDVETISQTRETWIDQCVLILKNLNVKAVLVQGEVDLNLLLTLNSKNFAIAVIHHVPYKVLRTISTATKTELTTYIRDVNKYNVASGIKLSVWRADWMDSDSLLPYIIVDCGHPTWTAVSCHPASALLRHKEEQFLHCAYRLQYAIERGVVLPGAGSTEQHSIQILKQLIDNCEISNRTLVFEMMIEVFNEFIEKIRQNSENQSATSDDLIGGRGIVVTYDDAVTKAAVWRTAANAVTTLIYTDIEIITGIEDYKLKLL